MTVPTPVPFSTLQPGTVYTTDNTAYYIVTNPVGAVDLASGLYNSTIDPALMVTPLPGAQLVLG